MRFGLGLHAAHLGQLLERGHARLVAHVVLAVAHGFDAERRAVERDAGADDQGDAAILQKATPIGDARRLRIALSESLGEIVLGRMEAYEFGAGAQQAIDLAVDMGMVDADHGEAIWSWSLSFVEC